MDEKSKIKIRLTISRNQRDPSRSNYEKAYACYRPECGESNAESAERHELIAAKVTELTEQRKGKQTHQPRIQHHFETATGFKHVIDNKQRRTTIRIRRQRITKEENAKLKEVNLTNDIPIQRLYTNNTQTYNFDDDSFRRALPTQKYSNTPNGSDHGYRGNIHNVTWAIRLCLDE